MDARLVKGYAAGIAAAVCYGTNPLGVLPLYESGANAITATFYRYLLAVVMLGAMLLWQRRDMRITAREAGLLAALGVLFSASSCTLYLSFLYLDAGLASTLLFVYPIMVAVIMALVYHEKVTLLTASAICMAFAGIALLNHKEGGGALSAVGVLLVMASSLTYAVYIVMVNKSQIRMSSMKMTFYVMLFGTAAIALFSLTAPQFAIHSLTRPFQWLCAAQLALMPTVISLVLMTVAIHEIGSTPAAIMGALEPMTAVVIGVLVFGEAFSGRLAVGMLMILTAVTLIVAGSKISFASSITRVCRAGVYLAKHWRWKG